MPVSWDSVHVFANGIIFFKNTTDDIFRHPSVNAHEEAHPVKPGSPQGGVEVGVTAGLADLFCTVCMLPP